MLGSVHGLQLSSGAAAAGRCVAPPRLPHSSATSRQPHGSRCGVVTRAKRSGYGRRSTMSSEPGPDEGAAEPNATEAPPKPAAASRKGRKRKTSTAAADSTPVAVTGVNAGPQDALAESEGSLRAAQGQQQVDDNIAEQMGADAADEGAEPLLAGHLPGDEGTSASEDQPLRPKPRTGGSAGRPRKADPKTGAKVAPVEVPDYDEEQELSLTEAVSVEQEKEDTRRFSHHRRLYTAAQDGNVDDARGVIFAMQYEGLEPGPAALHGLLFAYTKQGDVYGALEVAALGEKAGMQLLPESYQALIYSALETDPPDSELAFALFDDVKRKALDPTPAWRMLCTRLWARGLREEALEAAQEGRLAGYDMDGEVAEVMMEGLCVDGRDLEEAAALLGALAEQGVYPRPRLYNPLVRGLARRGLLREARALLESMYNQPRATPPNIDTYNNLLDGVVHSLVPGDVTDDSIFFEAFRDELLRRGLRPNSHTFRLLCEGAIKLSDADSAMVAFNGLRSTAGVGGSRMLSADSLAALQRLLAEQDKPYDLLTLLNSMTEDEVKMPLMAMEPIPGTGLTLLASWLEKHKEQMAARGSGQPLNITIQGVAADLRYINGVAIGAGDCAVSDFGIIIPAAKLTMQQVRAEAMARGIKGAMDRKRPELMPEIKAARDSLPLRIGEEQAKLQALLRERRQELALAQGRRLDEEEEAAAAVTAKKKVMTKRAAAKSGLIVVEGTVNSWRDGKLVESKQVREERSVGKFFRVRSERDKESELGEFQSKISQVTKELDLEATLTGGDLEEGVSDILNLDYEDYEDAALGGLSGGDILADAEEDDDDDDDEDEENRARKPRPRVIKTLLKEAEEESGLSESLMLTHFDNRSANMSAGMNVAMDIMRLAEMLGGGPTPEDLVVLVDGALLERSPRAATMLAPKLHVLAAEGGRSREAVAQLYEKLAGMCLAAGAADAADVVMEEAEKRSFVLSEGLLQQLQAALGGDKRRQEVDQQRDASFRKLFSNAAEGQELSLDAASLAAENELQEGEEGKDGAASAAGAAVARSSGARQLEGTVLDAEALDAQEEEVWEEGQDGAAAPAAAGAGAEQGEWEEGEEGGEGEWPEELAGKEVYEDDDGNYYVEYEPAEGDEVLLDAEGMWMEERAHYRQLLSDLGADEELSEADIDDILDDPIVLPNYKYLPAAMAQRKESADMGDRLRQEFAQSLLERFGEGQLAEQGALELVQAWAAGSNLQGEEAEEYERWRQSMEAALEQMPEVEDGIVVDSGLGGDGEEEETGDGSGLQQQQQQQAWQEGEEEAEALLELLEGQLTDEVLERFLETGTLDIPALDESFTQQEAVQVKATLESAYGDLPPDVLNTINSLAAADGAPSDADGSPGDAEAAGQLLPYEEFDAEEWEARTLEMLEARFAEEGISLEDALDDAVAEAVADAEAEEALLERGMERAAGRVGVAGAVGGGAGRCRVGGGRGEGLQWLWLGRNGWAPVAVRSAARLGGSSSSSSSKHC